MASNLLFYGHFVATKTGKTGLSPTVDIDKIEKATGTVTQVVTGGSATAGRRGYYLYLLANATPITHDYVAIFVTSDSTVDQQEVPATRIDYTEARSTELARLDAAISTRSTLTAAQANAEADQALADAGVTTTVTGRIDAAISSRLAAAGYTAPLDAGATQTAAQAGSAAALTAYDAATAADVEAIPTAADNAAAVADVALTDHTTPGSAASAWAASGSAADPLTNTVPGNYLPGTAGARLGLIGAGLVQAVSPVREDGERITLDIGDSYTGGRALSWTDTGGTWHNLDGWSAALVIHGQAEIAGTITGAGTADQQIAIPLAATDTEALIAGDAHPFAVIATKDGDRATIIRGLARIRSKIAA